MENLITTFHPQHCLEPGLHPDYYGEKKCVICEKFISPQPNFLYCRACDFHFYKECSTRLMKNLTIYRPKTHEHTLTFIRKKNSFNCDACGRVGKDEMSKYVKYEMNMYACLPCNFFIHRNCIYLPKVIKLTRHSHHLLHTFQVPECNTKCRLCDVRFGCGSGGYICSDKTCDYKLHSYCATRKEMWDGKDVEREPKDIITSVDVTFLSLEEVNNETIRHFSHHHDLIRQCVNSGEEEEDERVCQACIIGIGSDSFFGCKECDFALHDTCASLPRKMGHPFHRHPLTLEVDMMNIKEGFFRCSKCERESCGFMYRCCQEECEFKMDAKCASLADPLYNETHKHPLTLLDDGARCYKCNFYLDSRLATLPVMVKCNYDIHPLTLCFAISIERLQSIFHCEICETRIKTDYSEFQDFYGCLDCNTVVHVECAIGKYPYLKPGHTIKLKGLEFEIASNSLSRPICYGCYSICQDKLVFKSKINAISFCSTSCIIYS